MTAQDNSEFDLSLFGVALPMACLRSARKTEFLFQINAIPPLPVLLRKYCASPPQS
jgi:hypothetical protein